jgi:hypothetical protein
MITRLLNEKGVPAPAWLAPWASITAPAITIFKAKATILSTAGNGSIWNRH